jgi:hypothetical protein
MASSPAFRRLNSAPEPGGDSAYASTMEQRMNGLCKSAVIWGAFIALVLFVRAPLSPALA